MSPTGSCSVLSALDAALTTDACTTGDSGSTTVDTTKGTTKGVEGITDCATEGTTEGTPKDTTTRIPLYGLSIATQFLCREGDGHIPNNQLSTK